MQNLIEQKPALNYIIIFFVPIIGFAVGGGLSFGLGLNGQAVGNLIMNTAFLLAVLLLITFFNFSPQEMGLKIIPSKLGFHIIAAFIIFLGYMLFYIFVYRISSIKPIDSAMIISLVTCLIVVVAEELYFRGQLYSFIEKRFTAPAALVVSALLFGILHARQGLLSIMTKTITGALWGSVRYTTGMIYLLIFPIHFAFNATWLLFDGNWNSPPAWVYIVSIGEIILTIVILFVHLIQSNQITNKEEENADEFIRASSLRIRSQPGVPGHGARANLWLFKDRQVLVSLSLEPSGMDQNQP